MPGQRVVIVLPERPEPSMFALALSLREYFDARGYRASIGYGPEGFDDDLTPIDGSDLDPLMVRIEALPS